MKILNKIFKPKYPPDSAGGRMISNIPTALSEEKILDIRKKLFEKAREFETLNYIYILDQEGKLVGVLSLKEVFQKPEETKIEDLMVKEVVKVRPYTDQERVALLALKYNLKAIPVVAKDNKFLGVVTSDTILDILQSEYLEDILRSAGVLDGVYFPQKMMKVSIGILAKSRIPWLIFGLFGGILAAQISEFFETPLKAYFVLVAFIPLMVYIADAVGTQTQTLIARNLALDSTLSFRKYFLKELRVSFLIALILGVILSIFSIIWYQLPFLGLILGISLFFTVITAIVIGSLIPYLLQKFKQDPAIGSGPFATIVTDVVTLIIYFSIASLMLKLLAPS